MGAQDRLQLAGYSAVTVTGGFSNGGALYVAFIVAAGTANIGSVTNNG